uniref:Ell-associated factor Eaf n=2 Tax=Parastrongyloides trichosuri TaxID=131310 RepID=A0A0N4Z6I9_PARTI
MTTNSNCGLPIGVYQINIGESILSNEKKKTFHSVRYDFRPASISSGGAETFLQRSQNGYLNVAIENDSNNSLILYKGSDNKISNNKECMMILDPSTNKLTIEKLSSQMRVKYLRNPSEQIVQIIKDQLEQKKGIKRDISKCDKKPETINKSEEKSTTIKNSAPLIKGNENKSSKMDSTEDLLKGLDIDSPKNLEKENNKKELKNNDKGIVDISDFEDSSDENFDDILDKAVKAKEEEVSSKEQKTNIKLNVNKLDDDLMDFLETIESVPNKSISKSPKKNVVKTSIEENKQTSLNQNIFGSLDDSSDEEPIVEEKKAPIEKPKNVPKNAPPNGKMMGPGGRMWHDDLDLSEDEDEDSDDD